MIKIIEAMQPKQYQYIVLLGAAYLSLVINSPFLLNLFHDVTALGSFNLLFLLSVPVFLFCLTILVLSIMSGFIFIRPLIFVSIILGSFLLYALNNYDIIFDASMIHNALETNPQEAFSYLNVSLLWYVVFLGIIPAVFICGRKPKQSFPQFLKAMLLLNVVALFAVLLIAGVFYKNYAAVGRNHKNLANQLTPFKTYVSLYKVLEESYWDRPLAFRVLDNKPSIKNLPKSSITVMVVGETARAANFSLAGYQQLTNPFTAEEGVQYFSQVSSCGTMTRVSVPCMFSNLGRKAYKERLAVSQDNVLDLINRAGVAVTWVDNDNGCKGVCKRITTIEINPNDNPIRCHDGSCYDEVLVDRLKQILKKDSAKQQLILLHMIGSHGPTYYRRYPDHFKRFKPDCPRSDIQHCSSTELVNTYDNTVLYTDYVLSQVLMVLKQSQAQIKNLLYVSDHGESLGESGLYLHGFPYAIAPAEQTHVPLIYWSNRLANSDYSACVSHLKNKQYSQDNIFDTLLGLVGVQSTSYRPRLDILAACRTKQT